MAVSDLHCKSFTISSNLLVDRRLQSDTTREFTVHNHMNKGWCIQYVPELRGHSCGRSISQVKVKEKLPSLCGLIADLPLTVSFRVQFATGQVVMTWILKSTLFLHTNTNIMHASAWVLEMQRYQHQA